VAEEACSSLKRKGGLRDLILLFFPLAMTTFSASVFLFVEKLLLGRLSPNLMEAALTAAYPSQIFQGFAVVLAMFTQVWVGKWYGGGELKKIGPGVWQFIWFSFFSILFTIPLGFAYGSFYFKGTSIETIVWPYYTFLLFINFLYPLGTALTCFYLGQGKTRLVLVATIGFQGVKLLSAYPLIFGIEGLIPSLGLMGGAISTLIAQGGFCLLLFWFFLDAKHADMNTREWHFKPKQFCEYTYPGLLRGITRISMFVCWASTTQLMLIKGEEYLLVLSIGGIFTLFLPFIADALCQAQVTIVSHILGSKEYSLLKRASHSATLLALGAIILLAIPLILFPMPVFEWLFPTVILDETSIRLCFLGVWISYSFFILYYIPISYILAFKDTKFLIFVGIVNWINVFLFMYVVIEKMDMAANQFWLYISITHANLALLYWWRMRWLIAKANRESETAKGTQVFQEKDLIAHKN
jgi:multidrug resistance protein, MATE family